MKIAIIGGGAAGFYAALSAKSHHPESQVTIYEKSDKLLSKVKISGGGRCNVTHACFNIGELVKFYPRGEKQLRKSFGVFNTNHTISWFNARGVELKAESDGRMFPITDDSQTIIDCLMKEARDLGVGIKLKSGIEKVIPQPDETLTLFFQNGETKLVDKIIVATGGSSREKGFEWIKNLGHEVVEPVPSLFTFNMPQEKIKELMGVVVNPVQVRIQGTKLKSEGPLLITHWGMSGPAVLKLSSFGARVLNDLNYEFKVLIQWVGALSENEIRDKISEVEKDSAKKKIANANPFDLPKRFWEFLISKLELHADMIWDGMGKKNINRLVHLLMNDEYSVQGKTTFKEEFVTSGGIALNNVDFSTMQSKKCPNVYFAGEVLDVDGVTGGFNFQAAWTTGFIAGKLG